MAENTCAQTIREKNMIQQDIKQESEINRVAEGSIKAKSKRYSRRKSDGDSRPGEKPGVSPRSKDRPTFFPEGRDKGNANEGIENQRNEQLEPNKVNRGRNTHKDLSSEQNESASTAYQKCSAEGSQQKERKTRKGFEPYQVKRGKFSGGADPKKIQSFYASNQDLKVGKKDAKARREQDKQSENKAARQRVSSKKFGDASKIEPNMGSKYDASKGREYDKSNRPKERKRSGLVDKKKVELQCSEENWDLPELVDDACCRNLPSTGNGIMDNAAEVTANSKEEIEIKDISTQSKKCEDFSLELTERNKQTMNKVSNVVGSITMDDFPMPASLVSNKPGEDSEETKSTTKEVEVKTPSLENLVDKKSKETFRNDEHLSNKVDIAKQQNSPKHIIALKGHDRSLISCALTGDENSSLEKIDTSRNVHDFTAPNASVIAETETIKGIKQERNEAKILKQLAKQTSTPETLTKLKNIEDVSEISGTFISSGEKNSTEIYQIQNDVTISRQQAKQINTNSNSPHLADTESSSTFRGKKMSENAVRNTENVNKTPVIEDELVSNQGRPGNKKIYEAPSYSRNKESRTQRDVILKKRKNDKRGIQSELFNDRNSEEAPDKKTSSIINSNKLESKLPKEQIGNIQSDNASAIRSKAHIKKGSTKTVVFEDKLEIPVWKDEVMNDKELKNKGRTAGILVLPSPDVLKSEVKNIVHNNDDVSQKWLNKLGEEVNSRTDTNELSIRNKGDSSQPARNDQSRNIRISSSGNELWREIEQELKSLKKLLTSDFNNLENINKTLELSAMLQDLFKELIVKHQDISFKNDVESCLWKNTFHNLISKFRKYLENETICSQNAEISQYYWNVLQDGDDFLEDLLVSIQEEHNFDVNMLAANPLKMHGCKKQVKLAVRSCHLILLNLGDLERYITDLKIDNNYSKANEKYQKARSLAPKNGKSYNQLAIIAVKCKKKLDALYYYVRSLEASNPIESARERLTGIFQDIKRKAEQVKCKSAACEVASFADAVKMKESKSRDDCDDYKMDYSREDVWVFYRSGKYYKLKLGANGRIEEIGSHCNATKRTDDIKTTPRVSLRELNKEFLIYFLYMHSKFYTRIGFEYIMSVYQDTMRPFKLLLKHDTASSMKRSNLVKYMAINIFSVSNLFHKQEQKMEIYRDSPLDTAIVFGMDMCGQLASHCAELLQTPTEKNDEILDRFLPAVRVWLKWICVSMDLIKLSSVCQMKDIWVNIVSFFNATRSMEAELVQEVEDGEPTALFEDVFLAGFQPVIDVEQPSMKIPVDLKEKAEKYMRSESLKDMTFMVSESRKLPVVFSEASLSFEVVVPEVLLDSPAKNANTIIVDEEEEKGLEDDGSDVIIEDVLDESDEESRHFRELMAKKMQLTAKLKEQEQRENERAAIVESNASQVHMISENHPKFIVPDTNCFIENLEGMTKIIESKDFTVILPLIVMTELDGLKKGAVCSKKYISEAHASHVKERARLSVEFLENQFAEGRSQLKALTSVGTELDTIAFRDEELSRDQGRNDDIILSCCLHYCEEAMNRYSSNEGPLVVQRKVVLLTDDRNLRLKAHSRNVPTISLKIFMKMATL